MLKLLADCSPQVNAFVTHIKKKTTNKEKTQNSSDLMFGCLDIERYLKTPQIIV